MATIKEHGSGLITVTTPFKMMGVEIGNRMTIIQCENQGLWVHSPVQLDDHTIKVINDFGHVKWVVAPSLFHYLHVWSFRNIFNDNQLYGPDDIQKKETKSQFHSLSTLSQQEWTGHIESLKVDGMPKVNEYVFFHKHSKTLILTDLLFNSYPTSAWSTLFFKLTGVYNKCAVSRLYKSFIKDKQKFKQSVETILAWDFDRIIMSHGNIIESNGKSIFKDSFQWL